jgi:hypothetical protein
MSEAKLSLLARLRQESARLRYVNNRVASSPNMMPTFLEDDNLFILELFRHLAPKLVYDSARSAKARSAVKCIRRGSSLPKFKQYVASGASPQDQPAETVLRPSICVPMPGQLALCGGFDTIGVD